MRFVFMFFVLSHHSRVSYIFSDPLTQFMDDDERTTEHDYTTLSSPIASTRQKPMLADVFEPTRGKTNNVVFEQV